MAAERKVKQWITVNGHHIPIFEGESKQDAVDRVIKKNEGTSKKSKKKSLYDHLKNNEDALEEYGDGDPEVLKTTLQNMTEDARQRIAEEYDVPYGDEDEEVEEKQSPIKKQIAKDQDEKEKQIARNKKEADELNGKKDKLAHETYDGRSYAELNKDQQESIDNYINGDQSWASMMSEHQQKEADAIYKEQKEKREKARAEAGSLKGVIDEDKLNKIADRYNTSSPVSGSWDTETEHERDAIAKEFGISKDEAKKVMVDKLGFSESDFKDSKKDYSDTIKQASRIGQAMMKNKMSEDDMKELIDSHNGNVDNALRTLDSVNKVSKMEKERQLQKVMDIADRYSGTSPVSGSWDTETEHERNAIAKELGISHDAAKKIMIDDLGFSESDFKSSNNEYKSKFNVGDSVSISNDYGERMSDYKIVKKLSDNEIPGRFNKNAPGGYYEVENTREGSMFKGDKDVVWAGKIHKGEDQILKDFDTKEKQIAAAKKTADDLNNKEAFKAKREVDRMKADGVIDRKSLKKGSQYTFDWKNKDGSTKTVTGEFVRTEMGGGDPVSIFKGTDGKNYALYDSHMKGVKPIGELGGMGIHDTRMKQTKKAIAGGLNDLKSAPLGDLKELALDAGMNISQIKGMSKEDLRKAVLAIYKKG